MSKQPMRVAVTGAAVSPPIDVTLALVGRDRAQPALSEPVHPEMVIRIIRVREELEVEFEPIPFETKWVADPEVEIDNIKLVQEGQPGITKRRYRILYENDQEVERTLEDLWAEQPPINKIMAYGTKIVIRSMETPHGPIEYWRKMRVYTVSYKPSSAGRPNSAATRCGMSAACSLNNCNMRWMAMPRVRPSGSVAWPVDNSSSVT